ncbi:MAG: hypothetical protein K8E66_08630, partial [Phycisphaerales bacterium]|nr:hypothetical protein [Phycisphaerales bacterium]
VFLANSHPAVQMDLLSGLPNAEFVVADTMDLWINVARDDLTTLLGRVSGLALNYDEAELYTGHRNPVTAGLKMLEQGPEFVVIKKGEHGAILVRRRRSRRTTRPARPRVAHRPGSAQCQCRWCR